MATSLVTGGFGFLGSYVVRRLVDMDEDVVVYDLTGNNRLIDDIADKYEAVRGDMTNWPRLAEVVQSHGVSTIYHAAAMVAPQTEENLAAAFASNVCGTVNVCEVSRLLGVESLVYCSSTGVYGNGLGDPPIVDEDSPQFPWHMYGTTKVCCEQIGQQYHRKYGLNFRGLRLPPVLGAARKCLGPTAFCDRVIHEALQGKPYKVYVDPGTSIVSAMSVQDAAKAMIDLKQAEDSRLSRRLYNIDSMSFTAGELVEEVRKQIPGAIIEYDPDEGISASLQRWPVPSNERASTDWGWTPLHGDIASHVHNFIEEFRENPARFGQFVTPSRLGITRHIDGAHP
jgi:nucleoside-diphosphate-sugar epimerase